MPVKICPVCEKTREYSGSEWKLISRLPSVVCSRKCAWDFIEKFACLTGATLPDFLRPDLPAPTESWSRLLGRFFRSEYERHVAEAFSESGIQFQYEWMAFPVKNQAWWTPDFYLPAHHIVVEVKGPWGVSAKSKVLSFFQIYGDTLPLLILPWTLAPEFYPEGELS